MNYVIDIYIGVFVLVNISWRYVVLVLGEGPEALHGTKFTGLRKTVFGSIILTGQVATLSRLRYGFESRCSYYCGGEILIVFGRCCF